MKIINLNHQDITLLIYNNNKINFWSEMYTLVAVKHKYSLVDEVMI